MIYKDIDYFKVLISEENERILDFEESRIIPEGDGVYVFYSKKQIILVY